MLTVIVTAPVSRRVTRPVSSTEALVVLELAQVMDLRLLKPPRPSHASALSWIHPPRTTTACLGCTVTESMVGRGADGRAPRWSHATAPSTTQATVPAICQVLP